jgi:hypothetical protein
MRAAATAAAACLLAAVLVLAALVQQAAAHAVMIEPKSRQWYDYTLRYNYNPHAVNAGGGSRFSLPAARGPPCAPHKALRHAPHAAHTRTHKRRKHKHTRACLVHAGVPVVSNKGKLQWPARNLGSICGDEPGKQKWNTPGQLGGSLKAGDTLKTDIVFAQNHLGRVWMRLCPLDAKADSECTDLQRCAQQACCRGGGGGGGGGGGVVTAAGGAAVGSAHSACAHMAHAPPHAACRAPALPLPVAHTPRPRTRPPLPCCRQG